MKVAINDDGEIIGVGDTDAAARADAVRVLTDGGYLEELAAGMKILEATPALCPRLLHIDDEPLVWRELPGGRAGTLEEFTQAIMAARNATMASARTAEVGADLLKALSDLVKKIEMGFDSEIQGALAEEIDAAEAAIAKAQGRGD